MRITRSTILLLLSTALLWAWGCKPQTEARIVGIADKTNVPSNVIIPVQFRGIQEVTRHAIDKVTGLFALETGDCVEEAPVTPEATGSGENEGEKPAKAPQEKKTSVQFFRYVKEMEPVFENGEKIFETRVYIIPYSNEVDEPPLLPGERYCFRVASIPLKGWAVPEAAASFQVDENDEFRFHTADSLSIVSQTPGTGKSVGPNDMILVELNGPVHPQALAKGTDLCIGTEATENRDRSEGGGCGSYGSGEPLEISLAEDLARNEEAKYRTAQFNLYAFRGGVPFQPGKDYTLNIGVTLPGEGEKNYWQSAGQILFKPPGSAKEKDPVIQSGPAEDDTYVGSGRGVRVVAASSAAEDLEEEFQDAFVKLEQKSETKKKIGSTVRIQIQ